MAILPKNNKESIYASSKMRAREQQLIAETAAGDEKAFEQLYQLYFSRLFQFVFRITRTQSGIEEVINDVMYVVWDKASTYNQTCRPSTWIFGIAYFKALKSIEKAVADEGRTVEFNDELNYFPDKGTDWISQVETSNWLNIAFNQLSTEQRAVVEMTYFQGLHYNEIAEIMQCPENTVKTRMFHARKILAKSLQHN